MARISLSLLLLFSILYIAGTAESVDANCSTATDFLKASCRATRYPTLCVQSLAAYAKTIRRSQRLLVQAALSMNLAKTRSAKTFVSKMMRVKGIKAREYKAVKDCVDNMGDSVDRLSLSIRELGLMGRAGGQNFIWHMSNVQTWVSAALTDENTCMDGFAGHSMDGHVKAAIRGRIINAVHVTSNTLALVNQFAESHRAAAVEKP